MKSTVPLIEEHEFEDQVLKSPIPVVVDFGAEWCGPCRALEPVVERLATAYAGKVKVVRIDADASAAIAARYRVRGLPTVVSFVSGQEHKRHTGTTSLEVLAGLLPPTATGP
jgi:thioredoxin 1